MSILDELEFFRLKAAEAGFGNTVEALNSLIEKEKEGTRASKRPPWLGESSPIRTIPERHPPRR